MRSVTGGGELKFLDKLSPVLQLDMQTRLQWSKSVQMETLKINIPIIFLILPTANYPAYLRCKICCFLLDHPAPDRQLLAGQDVEQRSMR